MLREHKYFENVDIEMIYTTRFIASWTNMGGTLNRKGMGLFEEWLKGLVINGRHLDEEEISYIMFIAGNGKMELEGNARRFLKERNK